MACLHTDRTTCFWCERAVQHGTLCVLWRDGLLREHGGDCEQQDEWENNGTNHNYPSKTVLPLGVVGNAGLPGKKRPGLLAPAFGSLSLGAEEQDARRLVFSHFAYRAVEELVVFQVDLEEGRTLGNATGDQCF